jgi:PAS domain-containing protein
VKCSIDSLSIYRLGLAQQAGRIGTFEWDLVTDRVTWSIELEALYGLEPGSFDSNNDQWLATIYPEDRPNVVAELTKSRQLQQGLDIEFQIADPDTNIHWIAVKSSIFLDRTGNPTRTIGIHVDHKFFGDSFDKTTQYSLIEFVFGRRSHNFEVTTIVGEAEPTIA